MNKDRGNQTVEHVRDFKFFHYTYIPTPDEEDVNEVEEDVNEEEEEDMDRDMCK